MINDRQGDDLIDLAIQARLYDLKTVLLGRVQAYSAAAQTADVLPMGGTYQDGDPVPWPVLPDVPVAFPRYGGGSLTFPLAAGDFVVLLFASRATDAFVQDGIEDDPQSPRFGHLADAIALPVGVSPAAARLATASADDVVLTEADGGKVLIGAGATLAAARLTDTVAISVELASWIGSVISACAAASIVIPPLSGTTIGAIDSGSGVTKIE